MTKEIFSQPEGRLSPFRKLAAATMAFGLLLSTAAPCFADKSAGVGFVLLTSIMRSKVEENRGILYTCHTDFTNSRKDEDSDWYSDIYVTSLPSHRHTPFWTRVDESAGCTRELKKDVINRHPCLKETLEEALALAEEMAEDLNQSYSAVQTQDGFVNIAPEDMVYKLVVQSTDRNLPFIDLYGWDFSWLSSWNPFLSEENSCPFRFEFRHGVRLPNGSQQILQTYPLDIF